MTDEDSNFKLNSEENIKLLNKNDQESERNNFLKSSDHEIFDEKTNSFPTKISSTSDSLQEISMRSLNENIVDDDKTSLNSIKNIDSTIMPDRLKHRFKKSEKKIESENYSNIQYNDDYNTNLYDNLKSRPRRRSKLVRDDEVSTSSKSPKFNKLSLIKVKARINDLETEKGDYSINSKSRKLSSNKSDISLQKKNIRNEISKKNISIHLKSCESCSNQNFIPQDENNIDELEESNCSKGSIIQDDENYLKKKSEKLKISTACKQEYKIKKQDNLKTEKNENVKKDLKKILRKSSLVEIDNHSDENIFVKNPPKRSKSYVKRSKLTMYKKEFSSNDDDFKDIKKMKNTSNIQNKKDNKGSESDLTNAEKLSKKIVFVKKEQHINKKESITPKQTPVKKERIKNESGDGISQKKKKKDENEEIWKWWEETPHPDGVHWEKLEHNGPYFAPPYTPLPQNIKFFYNGSSMKLSLASEEVVTFYAKMLDSDYCKKDIFNENFFADWKNFMDEKEKNIITDFNKCDFSKIYEYYKEIHEQRKAMNKEDKLKLKEENEMISQKYGFCIVDGHVQKIGNFRIEPPGLFRGRGDHPKQGKIKNRVIPEDVTINISEDVQEPSPPEGHRWKSVVHDNKVTWLANWIENISGSYKYVMLNPTARIKGMKDMSKFDIARGLHGLIDSIRDNYMKDLHSENLKIRQRATALYFIDKLALRAGHEKEDGESADTVGCCSLRKEHITLEKDMVNRKYIVNFDFLGKDSVRYLNSVAVSKRVYKNLIIFMKNKSSEKDLFDKLSTSSLNKYLGELMEGLSAKVFRTYNASTTLQEQLEKLTNSSDNVNDKILSYNRANRAVAILCNHQRSIPKTFEKSMENLEEKIKKKKKELKEAKSDIRQLKKDNAPDLKISKKLQQLKRHREMLHKLKINRTDKEENKQIALGTSKLNYLDPRISVAWCKKYDVPIEKIYNKTQRDKFQWAIDMTDESFKF